MISYKFRALRPPAQDDGLEAVPEAVDPSRASPPQKILDNLLSHLPTEAVALVATLSPLILSESGKTIPENAWLSFFGALVLSGLIRWINKASRAVWITTALSFVLWMSIVPFGAIFVSVSWIAAHQSFMLILSAIYSAVVTFLASAGKLG